jgi:signal transduction histidine kinase/ligand-binding sensor domain-containing protein
MWVVSNFRLYHCDENGRVDDRGSFKPDRAIGRALSVFEDHNGIVWIGTSDNGLYRFDGSSFENIPISFHRVSSLTEDNEGNLWVGTQGGGLNRVQPRVVGLQGSATGLPSDMVMSICENIDGAIWAATQDGTLKSLRNGQWSMIDAKDSLYRDTVACVAADQAGTLWVGTRNGRLVTRSPEGPEKSFTATTGLAGKSISKLLATKGGDIWIALQTPDTLQRLRNGEFKTFPLRFQSDHIRAMAEDPAGNVWIASEQGKLWRIADDSVTDESNMLPQENHGVLCLHADGEGGIWLGTARGGVIRIKNGKASVVGSAQGMFDDCIAQIVPDGHGWTWFGSSKGIFKVRDQELDDVAEGRAERVRSMHYGEDEGLPTLHATVARSNGLRARDGRLWMIMASALATISPDKVHEQTQPPPVLIEKVTLDGREVASNGDVKQKGVDVDLAAKAATPELSSDFHRLRFDFTALAFNAPSNVQFQYRLDGYDEHWIDAGSQRYAIYSSLPPDNYRFEVKACNSDGIWNEAGTSLSFAVVPTLWQTWWFRVLAGAGSLAILLAIARYVWFRRLRQRLAALEQRAALDRERARIARDIHDDLGCGLTKIVLLSELSMQELNGSPQTASVRQIATTAKQQMKSLDETVWAINPRNDTLADLIDYISSFAVQSLRDAGVKCQVDLPDQPPDVPVPSEVRHSLFLAVKEAINNVLRHSQASEVAIIINVDNGNLSIVIADNGRGFAPVPAQLGQDGLRNMDQRLHEIGGTFQLDSTPGSGTRISLVYPLPAAVTAA